MSQLPQQPGIEPPPMSPSVNGWNAAYIDDLYTQWTNDPDSVTEQWRSFFEGFDLGFRPPSKDGHTLEGSPTSSFQESVDELVRRYRDVGHLAAKLDPLKLNERQCADLDPASLGLNEADMDRQVDTRDLPIESPAPLRDVIEFLQKTMVWFSWCGDLTHPQPRTKTLAAGTHRGHQWSPEGRRRHPETYSQRTPAGYRSRAIPDETLHRQEVVQPRRQRNPDPDAQ